MKTTLFSQIIKLESHLNQKTGASSSLSFFLNKLLMKATHYLQPPLYFIPKLALKDSVEQANFDYKIEDLTKNNDCIFSTEIKKITSKVDLTYKYSQQLLLQDLVRQATLKNSTPWKLCKYEYVSPLMTIIHLPKDPIENVEIPEHGSFHTDRDELFGPDGSIIVWLPFTNYSYPGVATKSLISRIFSHFLGNRIGRNIIFNSKSIGLRSNHKLGDWISWSDTFWHGGLRNSTDECAIALIIRFSKKYNNQTFLPVSTLLTEQLEGIDIDSHDKLVSNANQIFCSIIDINLNSILTEKRESDNINCVLQSLEDNSYIDENIETKLITLHIVDYALSTFSNRIKAFPLILKSKLDNDDQVEKMEYLIKLSLSDLNNLKRSYL